jgi:hypothetical protein
MTAIRPLSRVRASSLACGAALLWAAGAALAADPATPPTPPAPPAHGGDHPAPTKQQREQMAEAHEKIAACLRSDQPINVCHEEMMKMHEAMMHHHHHDMEQGTPPSPPPGAPK